MLAEGEELAMPDNVVSSPSDAAVGEGDSMQAGVAIDVFGRVFPVAFGCYHVPSRREALDG